MSISRKNWSALSSQARQWTMEDEEEVERERRRKERGSTAASDSDDDLSPDPGPISTATHANNLTYEQPRRLSSEEQLQTDFAEMLRVRDERRRALHVETLRQHREEEEGKEQEERGRGGEEGRARMELLGHSEEPENGALADSELEPRPTPSSHKFVSSVSISLDKNPSTSEKSGHTTPMSPCSPRGPFSPREQCPSPCQSPSPRGSRSPTQNEYTQKATVNGSAPNSLVGFEPTARAAFARQSSRTASFRMLKRREEGQSTALQRSSSVRVASKTFEPSADQSQGEDKPSPFQRNSRQRVSSRSIQEKMEKLAQAAQKSEAMRLPDMTQRSLFLMDEVSRKRCLFEKESQATSPTGPGVPREDFQNSTSGMSERNNHWTTRKNQTGSSNIPADLRHVNISSKKSLFESRGENDSPSPGPERGSK